MRPLSLGEHGDVFYMQRPAGWLAAVYYRDFSGVKRRLTAGGKSKAEARRRLNDVIRDETRSGQDGEFSSRSMLSEALDAWLSTVNAQVSRGQRAPATFTAYSDTVKRHVRPGVGNLRLGEVTTARLNRFLQAVLTTKGYATAKICRTVLSGVCGFLVRQDALSVNPVRDVTPLEATSSKQARALSSSQVRTLLSILDRSPVAVRKDLPELARFMLGTGLRIGEALGVRWSDVDLVSGVVTVERTVGRVKGEGLRAGRLKSQASYRALVLPAWCLALLKARRVRLGAFDGPLFPDTKGGFRDVSNTLCPWPWESPHWWPGEVPAGGQVKVPTHPLLVVLVVSSRSVSP